MSPVGIVEATERLYRSLFTAAVGVAVAMAAWGVAIAPFNGYRSAPGAVAGAGGGSDTPFRPTTRTVD